MADQATGRRDSRHPVSGRLDQQPVAATAALDLVEQGRLSLDRPVNEQLTSWRIPDSPAAAGRPVTLRRLLTHTGRSDRQRFPGYAAGTQLPTVPQVLDGAAPANTDEIIPQGAGAFQLALSGARFQFVRKSDGRITGITGDGRTLTRAP